MGVRFGRGVVAKTGYAMIFVLAVWAIVVGRIGPSWTQDAFLIFGGLVATTVAVWWIWATLRFAERNPAQALLEGAEFIEYRKWEVEAKGGLVASGPLGKEDTMRLDSKGA